MPRKGSAATAETFEQTSFDIFDEVQSVIHTSVEEAGVDYHTSQLAAEVLDKLRDGHPSLYNDWLEMVAIDQIKSQIGRFRSISRRRDSIFGGQESPFDIRVEIDSTHTQRRIRDCTRPDLIFASKRYHTRAQTMNLRARRLDALAKRLPDNTTKVGDTNITEEEVAEVFRDT